MTNKTDTETRILESADRLFLRQGFDKTTTAQIAREAGCNQALVHYYYRTKEHLFEKIYGSKIEMAAQGFLSHNTACSTFEEKVRAIVETHMRFLEENPLLVAFVLRESLNGTPNVVRMIIRKLMQTMPQFIKQLETDLNAEIAAGRIRPISVVDLILTIGSLDAAPFIIAPIIQQVLSLSDEEFKKMLHRRKEEVINTVLSSLRIS